MHTHAHALAQTHMRTRGHTDPCTHTHKCTLPLWSPMQVQLSNRRLQNLGGLVHPKGLLQTPLPPWLHPCLERCQQTGVFGDQAPNHVLVNSYMPGQGIMVQQLAGSCACSIECIMRPVFLCKWKIVHSMRVVHELSLLYSVKYAAYCSRQAKRVFLKHIRLQTPLHHPPPISTNSFFCICNCTRFCLFSSHSHT